MSAAELRERDLGEVIGVTYALSADLFGRLFLVQLLAATAGALLQLVLQPQLDPAQFAAASEEQQFRLIMEFLVGTLVVAMALGVLHPLASGFSALLVGRAFEGRPLAFWPCLLGALRFYPGLLLIEVTLGVIQTLGMFACLVPTFLFTVWFFVSGPAYVLEGRSWAESFGRSRDLTAGHRWEVFAVLMAAAMAPQLMLGFVAGLLELIVPSFAARVLLLHGMTAAISTVSSVAPVVVYYHLRVVKEALDVTRLEELVDAIGETPAT